MAKRGFTRNFKPLEILTKEQVEAIHRGTLETLEQTGVRIEHERALKLLAKNGCRVERGGTLVKFPPGLVEESLRQCPSSFHIKARQPENDLIFGGNTLYITTFPGMQTVDMDTWEPRTPTKKEFYDGAIVLDALDNIHCLGNYIPYFGYEGVPPVMCIPEGFAATTRNSTKSLKTGSSNGCEMFTIRIAQAVGADTLVSSFASPPLTYYTDAIEALYRGLEVDFPITFAAGAIMGGTGPVTIAGSTITNNAELIAGIVLAQLIRPGAKIALINFVFPQNMRSGIPSFGAIECSLHNAVFNQYFRRFGIPTQVANAGPISSKTIDFQCGYEKAIAGIISALSGANTIYLGGSLFGELTWHPVQAILDDDVAGMIGRFLRGVEVNDDTLALDLIGEVGPIPGSYLAKAHTRKSWKSEFFEPQVADRLSIPEWVQKGKKSAIDYAKERMEEILATHEPEPLTLEQDEDIERILEEARQYYRARGMM